MKIGILGGSFNPVHAGHIKVAQDVCAILGLDEVWFVCAGRPPHKKNVTAAHHRFAMLEMALRNYPAFFPCDVEIRKKFMFTIDTLNYLNGLFGKKNEFYFLVGFDAFLEITTWKDWKKLFLKTHFAIFNRQSAQDTMKSLLRQFLAIDARFDPVRMGYQYHNRMIHHLKVKSVNISGSEIREMVRRGGDVTPFVGREVADYIDANNLYR